MLGIEETYVALNGEIIEKGTVFARELGVPENQLNQYLDTNPVGRIVGDELYITANCEFCNDHSIVYHARIFDNAKILALKPDNYQEIIQHTMKKIHAL